MPDLPGDNCLPPHAYVPGLTLRHRDDLFDPIKASVTGDVPVALLHTTAAWRAGRAYFDAGYFWECHEVLEAVWLQTSQGSPEREITQAMIQLANARLKIKMNRPRAATRLCAMVEDHLLRCAPRKTILGLRVQDVQHWVAETRKSIGSPEM